MQAEDVAQRIKECRLTKVKICGLSTKEAVETAVSAGADYIGFVFAASKRQVTLDPGC